MGAGCRGRGVGTAHHRFRVVRSFQRTGRAVRTGAASLPRSVSRAGGKGAVGGTRAGLHDGGLGARKATRGLGRGGGPRGGGRSSAVFLPELWGHVRLGPGSRGGRPAAFGRSCGGGPGGRASRGGGPQSARRRVYLD